MATIAKSVIFNSIPKATQLGVAITNTVNYSMVVFYDNLWSGECKGLVITFDGNLRNYPYESNDGYLMALISAGYAVAVVVRSTPQHPVKLTEFSQPVNVVGAIEVLSAIAYVDSHIIKHQILSKYIIKSTKIILVGNAGGVASVCSWSVASARPELRGLSEKVVGCYGTSPIVGNATLAGGVWNNPMRVIREHGLLASSVNHKTLIQYPIGDTSHQVRSMVEIIAINNSNPLVTIEVVGETKEVKNNWYLTNRPGYGNEVVKFANSVI